MMDQFLERQEMRYYFDKIIELSDGSERMRHDAALAHLEAIARLAKEARKQIGVG